MKTRTEAREVWWKWSRAHADVHMRQSRIRRVCVWSCFSWRIVNADHGDADVSRRFDASRIRTCRRALEHDEAAQDAVRRIPGMKGDLCADRATF